MKRSSVLRYLATTVAVLAPVCQAYAQPVSGDASSQVDTGDIIVTAQKREERLSKVPETIQAFTADTIARAGISSLNDVGQQVPNIVLNRRQDNEANVVIRGVGSFGNTQGVGFYTDDVQNFFDQSATIEDVERIEVLKGPQGTLYGGSNVGGAVKYIMKQPGDKFAAEGRAEYGTFDTLNLFGAVDAPLSEDGSLAVRVSGYFNRTDGFLRNTFLNIQSDDSKEVGARVALKWDVSDRFKIRFSYRHSYLSNNPSYILANNVRDYHRTLDYNTDSYNHRTVDGGILQFDYDLGAVTATSITSYTHRKNRLLWEIDQSSADVGFGITGDRDGSDVFTQELRLTSSADGPINYIIGGYFSRITNRIAIYTDTDFMLGVDAGGPLFIPGFFNTDSAEKQYALFGTLNYKAGSFRLGAGLRLNRSEFEAELFNEGLSPSTSNTRVLPKLSLAYDFSSDSMLYANAAFGMEPGRVNLVSGTGDPYRPERAISYELGFKGKALDRRLAFDLAAFYIDYKDRQQEQQSIINGAVIEQVFNVGDSRSYGVEASLSYRPSRQLTLGISGGYLNAKWKNGSYTFDSGVTIPVSGLTVPFSPEFSGSASVDWRQPIGSLELGFRADVTHKGSLYWDTPNEGKAKSYELVNVRLALGDPDQRWEIAVRAENLFNVRYFDEFIYGIFGAPDATGNCAGCNLGAPGSPRRIMTSARFSF